MGHIGGVRIPCAALAAIHLVKKTTGQAIRQGASNLFAPHVD
jgi:hypothetical protein